jgi:hypothetical protein
MSGSAYAGLIVGLLIIVKVIEIRSKAKRAIL